MTQRTNSSYLKMRVSEFSLNKTLSLYIGQKRKQVYKKETNKP